MHAYLLLSDIYDFIVFCCRERQLREKDTSQESAGGSILDEILRTLTMEDFNADKEQGEMTFALASTFRFSDQLGVDDCSFTYYR